MAGQTPSQTVGPYLHIGLDRRAGQNVLTTEATAGTRIRVEGRVLDGDGVPVTDALVEIWQANAQGRYAHPADTQDKPLDPAFHGFGRCATDDTGTFWFATIKPGPVPGRGNTLQAPHLNLTVFARGMLSHATTRVYFADEAAANDADPVLATIDDADRRATLVAEIGDGSYRFDIVLQGDAETVFFDA